MGRSQMVNLKPPLVPRSHKSQTVNHKPPLVPRSHKSQTVSHKPPLVPPLLKSLTANLRLQLKLLPTLLLHPQHTLAPPTVKVFLAVLPSSPVLPELLLSSSRLADPLLQCDDE